MFKLDHLGIVVNDLDKAVSFYEELGFKLVRKDYVEAADLYLAYLEQEGLVIELLLDSAGKSAGLKHFALKCSPIEEVYIKLKRLGVSLLHSRVQEHQGLKFFFAQGTAGEWLEFVEEGDNKCF
jgi:catechol 2,3-dioxygenase-like lactoylglutathione lyase family enzyme